MWRWRKSSRLEREMRMPRARMLLFNAMTARRINVQELGRGIIGSFEAVDLA